MTTAHKYQSQFQHQYHQGHTPPPQQPQPASMTITMNINFNQSPVDSTKGGSALSQPSVWQPPYLQGNSYSSSKHLTSSDYTMHHRDHQRTFYVSKNRNRSLETSKPFSGPPPQITRQTPGIVIESRVKKVFN